MAERPDPRARESVTIRTRTSQGLAGAMVAVGVLGMLVTLTEGTESVLRFAAPLALFALAGWAVFWQPHVTVSDGGITVANTLRTIEVPWPAVEGVDGRYGLRLDTAYGKVTAWAAGAPTGRDRARERRSRAAEVVEQRRQELINAGYLDDRRLERPDLVTTWHVGVMAGAATLAVACVALPLLA